MAESGPKGNHCGRWAGSDHDKGVGPRLTLLCMSSPRQQFEAHVSAPAVDATVAELRENLTQLKLEAIDQVQGLDEEGIRLVMPGMYEQLVVSQVQLAAHVGLGVCLALCAHDELSTGGSLSRFGREVREQMTQMGISLKRRHASRLGAMVAEIEAQRLALRHSHEFASWLAFRRDDERYSAADRLERLRAFKVDQRLLQSRGVLVKLLGPRLTAAVEGADRFLLSNRWKLPPSPDHDIERYVWPLLSYQPGPAVVAEQARWEHDALEASEAPEEARAAARAEVVRLLDEQLLDALGDLPASALAGGF